MTLHLNISPEAEKALRDAFGSDLNRAALESMAIEGYRSHKLSRAEVGRLLGIEDRWILEKWLADRKVYLNYSAEDLDDDRRTLRELFGKSA
jgi:predicted HTH domain antitoxin